MATQEPREELKAGIDVEPQDAAAHTSIAALVPAHTRVFHHNFIKKMLKKLATSYKGVGVCLKSVEEYTCHITQVWMLFQRITHYWREYNYT